MTEQKKESGFERRLFIMTGILGAVGFVFVMPAHAAFGALPWDTPLQVIVNALNGSTGTLLATLAVMTVGVLAFLGRISWGHAGSVLFGIAILFGALQIVGLIRG
jgi:type IV secretion system protein VirB2